MTFGNNLNAPTVAPSKLELFYSGPTAGVWRVTRASEDDIFDASSGSPIGLDLPDPDLADQETLVMFNGDGASISKRDCR